MGGKSSSSSQQTYNTQNMNVTDNENPIVGGGDVSVNFLDGNAIKSSFDYASETQAFFGENFASVLNFISDTVTGSYELVDTTVDRSNEQARGLVNDFAFNTATAQEGSTKATAQAIKDVAIPLGLIAGAIILFKKVF